MVRRRWLLAQVAVLGALVALVLPASSSALAAQFIFLTPTGPSPIALTIPIGTYPIWRNVDTVAHTVTFASGCTFDVAPDAFGQGCVGDALGDYPYTVDGTTPASVTVGPAGRTVTLTAKRHGFRLGSRVRLHGTLAIQLLSPPAFYGPRMPVTVYARPRGHRWWYRFAVVMSEPLKKPSVPAHSVWHLWVRPHGPTTYRVEATSQPAAGLYWEQAQSRTFGLYVRRG